jgi:hypothetical protein
MMYHNTRNSTVQGRVMSNAIRLAKYENQSENKFTWREIP